MIIDCIADLHGHYPVLEGGDLLIVAGDLTATDTLGEHVVFVNWLVEQKYKKVIVVPGNHDGEMLDKSVQKGLYTFIKGEFLCDSGCEYEGLKIWGSPWTAKFRGMNKKCMAYTVDAEEDLNAMWNMIPDDTDILVTHGPPYGFFDENINDVRCGSVSLRNHVMQRIKPKLHVFGHIHEGGGSIIDCVITKFINCSIVDEFYQPVNPPMRVKI